MKTIRLMRHSTTIDGKNDVKNGKRATALAILVGAFDTIRNYTKAFTSPMQRARETGELVLEFMGLNIPLIEDEIFIGGTKEIADYFHGDEFKTLATEKGWTPEETLLSSVIPEFFILFTKNRGKNGLQRLHEIAMYELKEGESAIVFTHSGTQIEPIAIAALRTLAGDNSDSPFTANELPAGICWETESYVIEFNDDNTLAGVTKIGYGETTVVDLIKTAKKERL